MAYEPAPLLDTTAPAGRADSPRTVSVVICAYSDERWDDLVAAIESVRRQTVPALEMIVVIDRNPGLLDRVKATMPDVIAMPNEDEGGAGGARNTGVAAAKGEIIAFLDDDAEADPDWLEQLLPSFDDPKVLGIGGHIDPKWMAPRPSWFPDEFGWVLGCSYPG